MASRAVREDIHEPDEDVRNFMGSPVGSDWPEQNPIEDRDEFAEDSWEVDMSQTSAIAPGTYHARCQDIAMGTSKAGNRQFLLKVFLPEVNRSLDTQLSLAQKALPITADSLRAIGMKAGPDGKMARFSKSDVEGKIFRVKVIVDNTYDGIDRPKINGYLPANEATRELFDRLDNGEV